MKKNNVVVVEKPGSIVVEVFDITNRQVITYVGTSDSGSGTYLMSRDPHPTRLDDIITIAWRKNAIEAIETFSVIAEKMGLDYYFALGPEGCYKVTKTDVRSYYG